jgi:hypothetical protein
VALAARKANIVVFLQYHASGTEPASQAEAKVAAYARTLLGGVPLA